MIYPKINGIYKRWRGDEPLPDGVKKGEFKKGEFACNEFEYLFENQWVWSEKFDGMNMRLYIKDGMCIAKGKSDNADIPIDLAMWIDNWYVENKEALNIQFPQGVIFYGEGVGEKIQSGGCYGKQHFKLFDVLIGDWWLEKDVVTSIGNQFNLDIPQAWVGTIQEAIDRVSQSIAPISEYTGTTIEGYVGQPMIRLFDSKCNRISTKIKVKDFK